jgi:uncharacterized protein
VALHFFDSSAVAKRYHPESGSGKVMTIFAEMQKEIRISQLSFVEVQSVFAMKVRGGFIDRKDTGMQRARFLVDVAAGDIEVVRVTTNHFASAERLIGRHSFAKRLRTLDALQLAVALDLLGLGLLDYFVVADKALGEVATLEGLTVLDPAAP